MSTLRWPDWLSAEGVIVLSAGFLCQMITEGIIQAQDVFPPYIYQYFKCSYAEASIFHSVMHGFSEIMGPASSVLTKRLGERITVVLGATVVTAGFLGCSLSSKLLHLDVTSAIAGLGFGLMSVPIVTAVSFHFEKKRRYVMTTATTIGGALGAALFPFVLDAIMDENPWQYAFMFIACITAQLAYLGMLLSRKRETMSKDESNMMPIPQEEPDGEMPDGETQTSALAPPFTSKIILPAFLLSSLFWHIGSYAFELLPLRLDRENFNGDQIALVISMQAIFVVIGRLLATGSMGKLHLDPVLLYNIGTSLLALTRLVISWTHPYASYLVLVSASGLGMGIATALVPSVVLRLVGLKRLNFVFGLELLMRGLSGIVVPIVCAHLADIHQGNFFFSFFIGGLCLVIATIFLLPYHWPLSILFGTHYSRADVQSMYVS